MLIPVAFLVAQEPPLFLLLRGLLVLFGLRWRGELLDLLLNILVLALDSLLTLTEIKVFLLLPDYFFQRETASYFSQ